MTMELKHKRVLVLGLGDTGLSAVRWLHQQEAYVHVADTRATPPGVDTVRSEFPSVIIDTGAFKAASFDAAEIIVISPGVSVAEPLVQEAMARGKPVLGDVELFAQFKSPHAKVLAITGSNGKSTVTSLVGEMCQSAGLKTVVAGNIGLPVLDTLSMSVPDVYVLELSSFQLETTVSLNADAAVMLNLSEDHLDRHDGMEAYAAAKAKIFAGQGHQVLNREDAYSLRMRREYRKVVTFGLNEPTEPLDYGIEEAQGELWLKHGRRRLMMMSQCHLTGRHNAANVLAAFALCHAIGLSNQDLILAVRAFKGLPHRVEFVSDINGVRFYDDSKGTNVGATCAAIAGMQQPVVLIAGGDGKGQDFAPLAAPIQQNARAVILIGRDAPLIEQAIVNTNVPIYQAQDMSEAVAISLRVAQAGDAVLLSPACASFDMFKNYVHRAEVFVEAVQRFKQEVVA